MNYKKATENDYQGMLDLQNENFVMNLTDDEKKQGFLSVKFTKEQFNAMNKEGPGIVLCKDDDIVVGYLCTSSLSFNKAFALPAAMIELYPKTIYKNKALDQYHSIIIGPWCIKQNYRGKGIFLGLWKALYDILPKDINLLTTFISTDNSHSLYAAKKADMEVLTTFEFNKKEFWLLVKTH